MVTIKKTSNLVLDFAMHNLSNLSYYKLVSAHAGYIDARKCKGSKEIFFSFSKFMCVFWAS